MERIHPNSTYSYASRRTVRQERCCRSRMSSSAAGGGVVAVPAVVGPEIDFGPGVRIALPHDVVAADLVELPGAEAGDDACLHADGSGHGGEGGGEEFAMSAVVLEEELDDGFAVGIGGRAGELVAVVTSQVIGQRQGDLRVFGAVRQGFIPLKAELCHDLTGERGDPFGLDRPAPGINLGIEAALGLRGEEGFRHGAGFAHRRVLLVKVTDPC